MKDAFAELEGIRNRCIECDRKYMEEEYSESLEGSGYSYLTA